MQAPVVVMSTSKLLLCCSHASAPPRTHPTDHVYSLSQTPTAARGRLAGKPSCPTSPPPKRMLACPAPSLPRIFPPLASPATDHHNHHHPASQRRRHHPVMPRPQGHAQDAARPHGRHRADQRRPRHPPRDRGVAPGRQEHDRAQPDAGRGGGRRDDDGYYSG